MVRFFQGLSCAACLLVNASTSLSAAPTTDQFMSALSTCALNLRIEIKGDLIGSIRSVYDGAHTKGQLVFQQNTDFLNIFPASERVRAYELYTICVQSAMDTSGFDPFVLNKIVVDKTSIEYVRQKLGLPSEDDGVIAIFPVGGYIFRVYYAKDGFKSGAKNGPGYEVKPGTVGAISVSLSNTDNQKPLVLDGYWVPFTCSPENPCASWGTHKLLGSISMDELADDGCQAIQTGDSVGWNKVPSRILYNCNGVAGNEFTNAAFSCHIPGGGERLLLDIAAEIGSIKYHEDELRSVTNNPKYAADLRDIIKTLKDDLGISEDKFKDVFRDSTIHCLVDEYAIFGSGYTSDVLFEGGFEVRFGAQ